MPFTVNVSGRGSPPPEPTATTAGELDAPEGVAAELTGDRAPPPPAAPGPGGRGRHPSRRRPRPPPVGGTAPPRCRAPTKEESGRDARGGYAASCESIYWQSRALAIVHGRTPRVTDPGSS